ncbi:hypothetical protein EON80_23750 [bacterium]|nr:MAG: hypothetical protein EON80_23750 [bacterium]
MDSKPDEFDDYDPFADDDDELREVERRMNIHRLKNGFKEITGVEPNAHENPDAPAEILEGFWENVNEWERAPDTTQSIMWERDHAPLPPADDLSDEEVHTRLWEIIAWMASRRTYLSDTNHLSDRELYTHLRDESMLEITKEFSPESQMNTHTSPIGSGSEEDNEIYMRFYADDAYRAHWAKQFPDSFIPEKETPPYDRDRLLPQYDYFADAEEAGDGDEFEDFEIGDEDDV